jgi:hypothetical protein
MDLGATLYVKNNIKAADLSINAFGMIPGYNTINKDGSYLQAEFLNGWCRFLP